VGQATTRALDCFRVFMNTVKLIHPLSFMLAALLGLAAGACKEGELRAERVCKRHCQAMEDCTNTDFDTCVNNCVETADECDSESDVEMALDRLDACQKEECSNVLGCGIDAWVECKI
jgi:hypothetical protein